MRQKLPLLLIVSLLAAGCDEEGLNPDEFQEPGFSGTITFVGTIPPRDSIDDLRVVAVPYYPVDTTVAELITKILNQTIPYSGSLSDQVAANTTIRYEMFVKPDTFKYVAVAQLFNSANPFQDWRVVSIYGNSATNPSPVVVIDGEMKKNINFTVDFYKLPPQPFKQP